MKYIIVTIAITLGLSLALGVDEALAVPAEVVILLDTSRSMNERLSGPQGQRKIDLARRLVAQVAAAAEKAGHRVGLVRFRQLDRVIKTGEGPRAVVVEDRKQCEIMGDVLVGVDAGRAAAISRWVDGHSENAEPEITALGHSPLLGATRLVLRYIRARRMFDPQRNCVNAWIVVITDGVDTCAAGATRHQALTELRKVSHREDVRTLVMSFQPKSSIAKAIAALGQEASASPKVYAPGDAPAIIKAISHIEGRIAPDACLISGVNPRSIGLGKPAPPPVAAPPSPAQGCLGCDAQRGPSGASWLWLLGLLYLGLLAFRQRTAQGLRLLCTSQATRRSKPTRHSQAPRIGHATRRLWQLMLLIGLLLVGCRQGAAPILLPVTVQEETIGPRLQDPHTRAAKALAQQEQLLQAARDIRKKHLLPLLEPAAIFGRLASRKSPKDAQKACVQFVHALGYEPYIGIQRGIVGCLSTRQCNALDRALVLQACLQYFGISSAIKACRRNEVTPAEKAALLAKAGTQGKQPSVKAVHQALEKAFARILQPTPAQSADLDRTNTRIARMFRELIDQNTRDVVAKMRPMLRINPVPSLALAREQVLQGVNDHVIVTTQDGAFDPVLASPPACKGAVVKPDVRAVGARASLLVDYVVNGRWERVKAPLGGISWLPYRQAFAPLSVAIVDAIQSSMPPGLPAIASTGCLRGLFQIGKREAKTLAFPISSGDASACPGDRVAVVPGMALARITLRTELSVLRRWIPIDRVLVNRFGYIKQFPTGLRSGPMYSARSARALLPMRLKLLLGSGIPSAAWLLSQSLAELWRQRDALRARLSKELGGKFQTPKVRYPKPLAWTTMHFFAEHMRSHLPVGSWLLQPHHWRFAEVLRRGFEAHQGGLRIAAQSMFDIIDWPMWVIPPVDKTDAAAAEARLLANLAMGVLATEAERVAAIVQTGSTRIVNAGVMFRAQGTGTWKLYPQSFKPSSLRLPWSVREAALVRRRRGESLLMTPAPAPFLGGEHVAWWRIHNQSGMTIGEIRYDGTFYGGIATMKAVSSFTECLATQAILALRGVRLHPNVKCCMAYAAKKWLTETVVSTAQAGFDRVVMNFMASTRVAHRVFRIAYKHGKKSMWKQLKQLIKGDASEAPPCVQLVPTPSTPGNQGVTLLQIPEQPGGEQPGGTNVPD